MAAKDWFSAFGVSLSDPADNAATVTPSDSTDLANTSRSLYVGGYGNVAVIMKNGTTLTFFNVNSGSLLPVRVTRVLVTGTTATNIVALW